MFRGIFLDRDGTINEEVEYITSPDEVKLIPGAAEAIHRANVSGFKVIVITNQSAIARGLLTEEKLKTIHQRLSELLEGDGAHVDGIYYCPHHPDIGEPPYRTICDCRKPLPGMLRKAARDHDIDLSQSYVVGDRSIDLETGNAIGAYTILVRTGYGNHEADSILKNGGKTDFIAADLLEAVDHILIHASHVEHRHPY